MEQPSINHEQKFVPIGEIVRGRLPHPPSPPPTTNQEVSNDPRRLLGDALALITRARELLDTHHTPSSSSPFDVHTHDIPSRGTVIEGVFDGEQMVDADGKTYFVSPKVAARGELVEGDMLQLTVTPAGAYLYRLLVPCERTTLEGVVIYDAPRDTFSIVTPLRSYRVTKTAIEEARLAPDTRTFIVVPKDAPSQWGVPIGGSTPHQSYKI